MSSQDPSCPDRCRQHIYKNMPWYTSSFSFKTTDIPCLSNQELTKDHLPPGNAFIRYEATQQDDTINVTKRLNVSLNFMT